MTILSKFVMAVTKVVSVISTLNKQTNIISTQVTNPVGTIVNQVLGGAWKGDGATRFVEEMTSLVRPSLTNLTTSVGATGTQVNKAMERMQQADQQAKQMVSQLTDVFKAIYH